MKNAFTIELKSTNEVVSTYAVYVKGTVFWLGTFRTLKQAERVAKQEVSNYPKGDRVIYAKETVFK